MTSSQPRKLQYSILTLLLLTALVGVGISRYLKSPELEKLRADDAAELKKVKDELKIARDELGYLNTTGDSDIYAVSLPTFGPMQWRWRIQLPKQGQYQIRTTYASDIPEDGFPKKSQIHNHIFFDQRNKPLSGGVPFILLMAVEKHAGKTWATTFQIKHPDPDSSSSQSVWIPNPPDWLENWSPVNWSSRTMGNIGTQSVPATDRLLLLSYRKSKTFPGGSTVEMQPTDGFVFWIEPIGKK